MMAVMGVFGVKDNDKRFLDMLITQSLKIWKTIGIIGLVSILILMMMVINYDDYDVKT